MIPSYTDKGTETVISNSVQTARDSYFTKSQPPPPSPGKLEDGHALTVSVVDVYCKICLIMNHSLCFKASGLSRKCTVAVPPESITQINGIIESNSRMK
jgi:hypothetical protein